MRKLCLVFIALAVFVCGSSALETTLVDMREKFFQESKEIKPLLEIKSDALLVTSMWDACLITMSQLDAYFYMIGIFNTISKSDEKDASYDFLARWLDEVKKMNEINVKNLGAISFQIQPQTKTHVEKLIAYYTELNNRIDTESKKIALMKMALNAPRGKRK